MASVAWPKILGFICGFTSLGLVLSLVQDWWIAYAVTKTGLGAFYWLLLLASVVLFVLSFPLYRARDWARRGVLILGTCFALTILGSFAMRARLEFRTRADAATAQERVEQFTSSISQFGMGVCILGPQVFFLCALCHRDVVATFRRRSHTTPPTHDQTT